MNEQSSPHLINSQYKHEFQSLFLKQYFVTNNRTICTRDRGIGIASVREHRYQWSLNKQCPVSTSQRDCRSCEFSGLSDTETFDMIGEPPRMEWRLFQPPKCKHACGMKRAPTQPTLVRHNGNVFFKGAHTVANIGISVN